MKIKAKYTRTIQVSSPEGPASITKLVMMAWTDKYRYELFCDGEVVPESPQSIDPMKLNEFMTGIGYKLISWAGTMETAEHGQAMKGTSL
jgi:hypothetical protein